MAGNDLIWSQVREACNIVEIIGEHVALKRAGREFKGLCPFHEDHRPSMSVVPHKQLFHCFVCGTGGDVFKFVELFHKMSKGETLRFLAQKTGIKLPELSGPGAARAAENRSIRETVTETNERACAFFEKTLMSEAGKEGLAYLKERGLTAETIRAFRIGMSPDKWTGLTDASMRLGVSGETLLQAGLVKKRGDGSFYDAFRNRVIFPIIDAAGGAKGAGRVIAFGGRVLEEKRDEAGNVVEAKYLNSPETPVFNKSASLYGLDRARQAIIKTQTAVIVEGYMDVIACHQAGVTNVVATLGTAMTIEHARILKRFCNTVVLIFDSDDAGFRAADRAMQTLVREPIDVKIASVPDGKDPCDFCISRGAEGGAAFEKIIASATDMLDYQWAGMQRKFHANTGVSARTEAASEFMRFVGQGLAGAGRDMDPVRRGMLFSKIAGLVGMTVEEAGRTLKQLAAEPAGGMRATPAAEEGAPAEEVAARPFDAGRLMGLEAAEGWVIGSLLVEPKLYTSVREELSLALFSPGCLQKLAGSLIEYLEGADELTGCSLAEFISSMEDSALVNQAIQLEGHSSEWLSPTGLSPEIERVVKNQQADMGRSASKRLVDALHQLMETRGEAAQMPAEPPADDAAALLEILSKAKERNSRGGNQRILGRPSSS